MEHSIFWHLKKSGLISENLIYLRNKAKQCGIIPDDVKDTLDETQCKLLAEQRYSICKEFQKELEDFYRKNYSWKGDGKGGRLNIKEIASADHAVSHDANGTLMYVKILIEKDKDYRKALDSISKLPSKFVSIYELYIGYSSLDIKPYFPELFPKESNES